VQYSSCCSRSSRCVFYAITGTQPNTPTVHQHPPSFSSTRSPSMSNPPSQQQYETPRRQPAYARPSEELHIPLSATVASNAPRYTTGPEPGHGPPSINIQQSTPHHPQYGSGSSTLPGALQPGNMSGRPVSLAANAAPSAVPTLPPLSTQSQQANTPSRSGTVNHTHVHSRSSPAGFEQPRYRQYGTTPESAKYSSPPGSGMLPHTPSGAKYSPLGLADIRPPSDSLLMDHQMTPGSFAAFNGDVQVPTNSNYVAPWPIYAVDWCKWPMSSGNSFAGKVAIGSYLEDSHNYVGSMQWSLRFDQPI
jgi:DDB1- and CUL4-associated factor 7